MSDYLAMFLALLVYGSLFYFIWSMQWRVLGRKPRRDNRGANLPPRKDTPIWTET